MNPYHQLFRKPLLWIVSIPAVYGLAFAALSTKTITPIMLNQAPISQNAALTNALYQDFLYTAKNIQLQVGNNDVKVDLQTLTDGMYLIDINNNHGLHYAETIRKK